MHAAQTLLTPEASFYTPTSRDQNEMFFLRQGGDCWMLLFTTLESIRAYRLAAGITDRCNMCVFPSEATARTIRRFFGLSGNHVVGVLIDPAAPSPQLGTPVTLDEFLQWVDGGAP